MKKIFLVLIVLVVISFVPIFKGSSVYTGANPAGYNGPFVTKVNFWRYIKINSNTKTDYKEIGLSTREEVIFKNGFTVESRRASGGLILGHPGFHIDIFSDYWGKKIEKVLLILQDKQFVYDELVLNPVSICPNCDPLFVGFCTNIKEQTESSILGLYETKGNDPIKAWTVDPKTLKFVEYTNVEDLKCNLPEF